MTREEREMDIWQRAYNGEQGVSSERRKAEADAALKAFREAFPGEGPSLFDAWRTTRGNDRAVFLHAIGAELRPRPPGIG